MNPTILSLAVLPSVDKRPATTARSMRTSNSVNTMQKLLVLPYSRKTSWGVAINRLFSRYFTISSERLGLLGTFSFCAKLCKSHVAINMGLLRHRLTSLKFYSAPSTWNSVILICCYKMWNNKLQFLWKTSLLLQNGTINTTLKRKWFLSDISVVLKVGRIGNGPNWKAL